MGRAPCCEKEGLKKGPWTPEEDQKLVDYIKRHGHGCWRALPKRAGLLRCGKSCRLRWTNYLRPDIKRGKFSLEEEQTIIHLHGVIGNKWSAIAAHLPGRTDNEIKNFWNTHLRKRLLQMGIDPVTHRRRMDLFDFGNVSQFLGPAFLSEMTARLESARLQEAMTREYYRRIAEAAMIPQQQNGQYNQNAGAIGADEVLMRSQLENPFSRPNFISNSISSQLLGPQNQENQVGSLEYNALVSQALEQLQSQAQIMKNMQQHPSTVNGLNPLPTMSLEDQGNNNVFNDRACVAPHQKLNSNQAYNNFLNASTLMVQQPLDVNSPLGFDASILWPQENLIGVCKSDSESLPALVSSSSSPNIFSDSDLVHDASSSMLNMNVSSTASTTKAASNASYASPLEFLFDFSANSKQNEKIPQDGGDYWSNILQYVGESGVDKDLGLQSIYEQ